MAKLNPREKQYYQLSIVDHTFGNRIKNVLEKKTGFPPSATLARDPAHG